MGIIINGQNDTIGPVDNDMSLLGNVSIGGTMTIEDFTNIDSVGLITARNGLNVTGGQVLVAKTTASITTQGSRVDNGLITVSGNSNTTNLATNGGGNLSLANIDSTDNNFSNIGGYNSNGLVVSQIDFINKSHSSRTGDIAFLTHNGSVMSERLRITSDGNIGVGVVNPTQKFMVKGIIASEATNSTNNWMAYTYTDNTFRLNYNGAGADEVVITSGGAFGIGANNPDTLLHVRSSDNVLAKFESTDPDALIEFKDSSTTDTILMGAHGGDDLLFRCDAGNIKFYVANNNEKLRITSAGRVGVNIDNPNTVLHIKSSQNSDGLTVTKGSNVSAFLGHNGSGDEGLFTLKEGGTTKIQLYAETNQDSYINSGDFGIGTNSPVTKLDVRPTAEYPTTGSPAAGSFLQIRADDATVGKGPSLALMNLSGSKETGWRLSALTASGNNGDFTIHGYGGGATYSERLRITADGKTGIGGITPQNLLNVNATGSMGLYGTTAGKAGHSIRFIRKYGSSATHNFAVVNGASPHGQSRLGGFVATYTFRSAYGFDGDGGGHGVRMLSGRVRDSGEWGFDTETNYGTGDSPRPTLQGVDNSDGTCTLQVVNPGSTHSYGEFHIVAWDCQITTPTT